MSNEDAVKNSKFTTHTGHALNSKQAEFINRYIETGNAAQSVLDAGYQTKEPAQHGKRLLDTPHISEEIRYRLEQRKNESIANAEEIMQYFTDVMRGKIADQFGLEAPLSERTKAAQELAKRQIDIPQKLQGNEAPKITITVDWGENAVASYEEEDPNETVDTQALADMYDTKKRDVLN